MKILNPLRTFAMSAIIASTPLVCAPVFSQEVKRDTFEHSVINPDSVQKEEYIVPPSGTSNDSILKSAPNPEVSVAGVVHNAKIVVDLSTNVLYTYDRLGKALMAYRVASGAKKTPTHKGLSIVSHTEKYPYTTAYGTKRKRNPRAYGPHAIILQKLDPKTGEKTNTGEFIHGNNNQASLGQYASLGRIRMDNEVIKIVSKEVERGDIILIK